LRNVVRAFSLRITLVSANTVVTTVLAFDPHRLHSRFVIAALGASELDTVNLGHVRLLM
jgi:hypothetical protein